jgi:GT2 family glycosyltransferase
MSSSAAIVIVNWNGYEDTRRCLRSLRRLQYENYSVVVVDNASSDGSVTKLGVEFPEYVILQSGANGGFAAGANIGIRHALDSGASYILLLNSDTEVESDVLTLLIETAATHEDVGLVGSKVACMSQPERLWSYGGAFNLNTGQARHFLSEDERREFRIRQPWYLYVPACALLIRRECIQNAGFLSERYFHLAEDVEYCIRAQQKGWKIALDPRVTILHRGSASMSRFSPLYNYYEQRNRLFVVRQYRIKSESRWPGLRDGLIVAARLFTTIAMIDKFRHIPKGIWFLALSIYDFYCDRDGKR